MRTDDHASAFFGENRKRIPYDISLASLNIKVDYVYEFQIFKNCPYSVRWNTFHIFLRRGSEIWFCVRFYGVIVQDGKMGKAVESANYASGDGMLIWINAIVAHVLQNPFSSGSRALDGNQSYVGDPAPPCGDG